MILEKDCIATFVCGITITQIFALHINELNFLAFMKKFIKINNEIHSDRTSQNTWLYIYIFQYCVGQLAKLWLHISLNLHWVLWMLPTNKFNLFVQILNSFIQVQNNICASTGHNEGGKGGHSSLGVESLWGVLNDYGWHRKVPTTSQAVSAIQHICFRKTSGSNIGAPHLLLTPGTI